jgi:hypothetical protein
LIEANETVRVTLAPSPHYAGDGTAGEAVVTIVDNDNVLVDDDLVVYYTFDNASLDVEESFAAIRNEAGADHALRIQSYMHTMPILAPGPAKYGDAIRFPEGRESVRSSGSLDLGDFTVAFWFQSPQCHNRHLHRRGGQFLARRWQVARRQRRLAQFPTARR